MLEVVLVDSIVDMQERVRLVVDWSEDKSISRLVRICEAINLAQ